MEPEKPVTYVNKDVSWAMYLRILVNFIIEYRQMKRGDIEQLVREYERTKKINCTEKQLYSRTRMFLTNFFGKTILDWPTFTIILRCFKAKRFRLTVTFYDENDIEQSYSVETEHSSNTKPGDTQ